MTPSKTDKGIDEKIRSDLVLEDYKAWLRELEKQDRWYAQTVWAVVAALGAALLPLQKLHGPERMLGAWGVWAVGAAFVHMSATFLMFRIVSHRNVSRAVAHTRRLYGTREALARDELAGAPLLSNNPAVFKRSTRGGGAFGFLFLAHQIALASVAVGACWAAPSWPQFSPPSGTTWLLLVAAVHFVWMSSQFHWKVSEAWNLGEFIVTRARDAGVLVHHDAEIRLREWFAAPRRRLIDHSAPAVRALVAYEDRRYFRWFHVGVDVRSIVAVALRARRGGASTIPMQLSRQLLRSTPNTFKRKTFEAALAIYITLRYGKRRVLDLWLRNIPFGGPRIVGIEQAAGSYFQKTSDSMDELDGLLLAERATVHTSRYYPDRTRRLVAWAVRRKIITEAQREDADVRIAKMISLVPGEIGRTGRVS